MTLSGWMKTLSEAPMAHVHHCWGLQRYGNKLLICPPITEYPGAPWLPINSYHVATWEELMQMPEPYKTRFLKLRVLLPADDTIRVEGLGRVDADQWIFVSVDELDLDSDKML